MYERKDEPWKHTSFRDKKREEEKKFKTREYEKTRLDDTQTAELMQANETLLTRGKDISSVFSVRREIRKSKKGGKRSLQREQRFDNKTKTDRVQVHGLMEDEQV